jgi:hypothetical protein
MSSSEVINILKYLTSSASFMSRKFIFLIAGLGVLLLLAIGTGLQENGVEPLQNDEADLSLSKEETPDIVLSSNKPQQGDTVLVWVPIVEDPGEVSGQFGSNEITFFRLEGSVAAIIGIDLRKAPGEYKLAVSLPDSRVIEEVITVIGGDFPVKEMAFTPELEEGGYNAGSVVESIAENDGPNLYAAMAASSDAPYFQKSFAYPLDEIIDVGPFGDIRKSGQIVLRHLGVDLDAASGTPVYAVNDGLVTGTLDLFSYGKTMVIDHGLGLFSLYLHLDEFSVALGQEVERGQVIGMSGNTGYSIEPHLHFSIKAGGANIDPLKFIEATRNQAF